MPSGDHPSSDPRSSIVESAIMTIDRRKWNATTTGLRVIRTAMPPTTAWMQHAGHQPDRHEQQRPAPSHPGEHHPHAGEGEEPHDAGQRPVPELDQLVDPLLLVGDGVNEPGTHSGQVGQPRPLPVSRTMPPVMTMTISPTRLATRIGRTNEGRTAGSAHGRHPKR